MPLPNRIDVIRHPEWSGNLTASQSLLASERDLTDGLTETGTLQAIRLGGVLKYLLKPDIVLTSPYLRAREGARLAVARAWPGETPVRVDERLREQDKGTDPADHYDDDNLYDRPYPGGETLRQVGRRALNLLRENSLANTHAVLFTHARFMLALRIAAGRHYFSDLRDHGLPNSMDGVFIDHCQIDTYLRMPAEPTGQYPDGFTHMFTTQTWGDAPRTSGIMKIKR